MTYLNRLKFLMTILLITLFLNSCSFRTAGLSVISTKSIDYGNTKLDSKYGQRQKASDCVFRLFGFIPFGVPFGASSLHNAVNQALDAGNGNIIIDQATWISSYYLVLGWLDCIRIEGTVLTAHNEEPPKDTINKNKNEDNQQQLLKMLHKPNAL